MRVKPQTNGRPKFQGAYTLKDTEGMPIDVSYELAKEQGLDIDWVEAVFDALRQSITKYDGLMAEIKLLEPSKYNAIDFVVSSQLMARSDEFGGDFVKTAGVIHKEMMS